MQLVVPLLLILGCSCLLGCVRAGFDAAFDSGSTDSSVETNLDADAEVDASAPVDPYGAFGTASPVTGLNSANDEDDPSLTADMLEIYFERSSDIWRSRRSATNQPWDPPGKVARLNSSELETNPEMTPDGLTIFITSTRSGPGAKGAMEIYRSTRSSRSSPWTTPQVVDELNSVQDDCCVAPSPDLQSMVISTNRTGGLGDYDLYISTRVSAAAWGPPQALTNLNTAGWDASPWISTDRKALYFVSRRAGDYKIFVTTRPSLLSAFAPPVQLKWPNAPTSADDPWLSADQRTLYYSHYVGNNRELYYATRK